MTGPEHYQAAELLVDRAENFVDGASDDGLSHAQCIALAQVHAMLAQAAATAMAAKGTDGMDYLDFRAWDFACGVQL